MYWFYFVSGIDGDIELNLVLLPDIFSFWFFSQSLSLCEHASCFTDFFRISCLAAERTLLSSCFMTLVGSYYLLLFFCLFSFFFLTIYMLFFLSKNHVVVATVFLCLVIIFGPCPFFFFLLILEYMFNSSDIFCFYLIIYSLV